MRSTSSTILSSNSVFTTNSSALISNTCLAVVHPACFNEATMDVPNLCDKRSSWTSCERVELLTGENSATRQSYISAVINAVGLTSTSNPLPLKMSAMVCKPTLNSLATLINNFFKSCSRLLIIFVPGSYVNPSSLLPKCAARRSPFLLRDPFGAPVPPRSGSARFGLCRIRSF